MAIKALLLLAILGSPISVARLTAAQSDPLASWNEGPAKLAIVDFVRTVTDKNNPKFVSPEERIAVFDNDGTLWVEQPIYAQFTFAFDRVIDLAPKNPQWNDQEPWRTILARDTKAMAKFTQQDVDRIIAVSHSGMTVEAFQNDVKEWLVAARHPRFKRPYTELVYQPMLELMQYLRANGFKTYIVTGGGQEFLRAFAEKVYGVPPEQVIGSAGKVRFEYDKDSNPVLMKLPEILLIDDKGGKPESISMFVGRRPVAAFGNSTGDQQMLEWTGAQRSARLMMLVHHDDADREYTYGATSKIGPFPESLMAEAKSKGWVAVSMKNDWKKVFPFEGKTP